MALFSLSQKSIQTIKSITNSTYLDFIGLVIVISASLALGYQKTVFNFTFHNKSYIFFLGYISIVNTGFSMMGNRLVTKKNNFGNFITTCNTFLSGSIDYLLGNVGAILTYPVSFIGNFFVCLCIKFIVLFLIISSKIRVIIYIVYKKSKFIYHFPSSNNFCLGSNSSA